MALIATVAHGSGYRPDIGCGGTSVSPIAQCDGPTAYRQQSAQWWNLPSYWWLRQVRSATDLTGDLSAKTFFPDERYVKNGYDVSWDGFRIPSGRLGHGTINVREDWSWYEQYHCVWFLLSSFTGSCYLFRFPWQYRYIGIDKVSHFRRLYFVPLFCMIFVIPSMFSFRVITVRRKTIWSNRVAPYWGLQRFVGRLFQLDNFLNRKSRCDWRP